MSFWSNIMIPSVFFNMKQVFYFVKGPSWKFPTDSYLRARWKNYNTPPRSYTHIKLSFEKLKQITFSFKNCVFGYSDSISSWGDCSGCNERYDTHTLTFTIQFDITYRWVTEKTVLLSRMYVPHRRWRILGSCGICLEPQRRERGRTAGWNVRF